MTRVVLIRPGCTDYDEQDRIQGNLDIPLSSRGVQEVAQTAEELRAVPLSVIYGAAGKSASDSARGIGKAIGIKVRKLGKLQNLNQGLWQGLQVEEVRRKHPRVYRQWCESPTMVCPPNGETVIEAYQRVRDTLRSVLRRHRDEVIGLVVAEPLARVVRCYLLQHDLSRLWQAPATNGRWEMLEVAVERDPSHS